MPDNSAIIEELVKAINNGYGKQQESLERLIKQLESAQERDASQQVISKFINEIDKLNQSIEEQKNNAQKFYDKMSKLAGGRDKLDNKLLKDAYKFRNDYAKLTQKLEKLIASKNERKKKSGQEDKSNQNQSEINNIETTLNNIKDELIKIGKKLDDGRGGTQNVALAGILSNISSKGLIGKDKLSALEWYAKGKDLDYEKLKNAWAVWSGIEKIADKVKEHVIKSANYWLKFNERAISDAKRLGMTTKEEAMGYMGALMENSKALSRNFGMTAEQAMKMQDVYVKVTGRAAILTQSQMEDIAAASKLMGEESVQSAMNIMDKMGSTSQVTMELMDKNFVRAANSGLDTVKASEEFVKNMSLANKLNFRNGVDGISKMTILSQRVKMNLQEVANVAEKFSTIEGAIEGSARLQMLGGAGALYGGNPMQMMYESLTDPEALYKRMVDIFGQQAVFDRRTGEAKIDPVQMQIIREQAKAMGMNPDEAIQSAKQQAKLGDIESDLRRKNPTLFNNLTEEQKAAISNKAEFDKENQTWNITYIDETGEKQTVDVKDLSQEQLNYITKDNAKDVKDIRAHVRKIATALIGTQERWNSMRDQWYTSNAQAMHGDIGMKGVDSLLDMSNNSGIWKTLTAGSILALLAGVGGIGLSSGLRSAIGIGKGKFISNWIIPRLARSKFLKSKFFNFGSGSKSSFKEGFNARKNVSDIGENFKEFSKDTPKTHGAGSNSVAPGTKPNIARLRKLVKAKKALTGVKSGLRFGSKFVPLAAAPEVVFAGWNFYQAGQERQAEEQRISQREQMTNGITERKRFTANDIEQQRIKADNKETDAKVKAIGTGTMALAGAKIGFSFGGVWGAAIGAALGGAIGAFAGGKLAPEKQGDIIAEHIKEIEKGDEEDNFKKIVLPVESIDYNVSLIANQLGILTASPARNNVYLEAEANGEIAVEGKPLEASIVNEVDTYSANNSKMYHPSGPLTLNVNGSIDLNMKGINIGKLTAEDFMQMFNSNPELQRQIAAGIKEILLMANNGGRISYNPNVAMNNAQINLTPFASKPFFIGMTPK